MFDRPHQPWLHRFACITAGATLFLISIGGLVTSKDAGMSVPDWPTTYGYNMFLFPISKWVGGVFWEHSHRLAASLVGFLTVMLAGWLWAKEPRAWVRRLGWLALFSVVLQGVLGGLRVVWYKDQIGIFHAALAQLFLVMVCVIALVTGRWWGRLANQWPAVPDRGIRWMLGLTTALIFGQLLIGATMRHQHAGLAIPDFPLAYHKVWPPTDPAFIALVNQNRMEVESVKPITGFQIVLQMVHRIIAVAILGSVAFCAWRTRRQFGARHPLAKVGVLWLALICVQVFLGAWTIWSNKAADIATAHVVTGALSLVTGALSTMVALRVTRRVPAREASVMPDLSGAHPATSVKSA